jgi:hypothetical protein
MMDPTIIAAIIGGVFGLAGVAYQDRRRRRGGATAESAPASPAPHSPPKPVSIYLPGQPGGRYDFDATSPLERMFASTNQSATEDLVDRLKSAEKQITIFGLTRNFYVDGRVLPILREKSRSVPVTLFLMDPKCASRRDRYRLEPTGAALESADRMRSHVLRPMQQLLAETRRVNKVGDPGLSVYFYNFPCSFGMERIDSSIRVMLYGHGKRGTDSPVFVFRGGTTEYEYFSSQVDWLLRCVREEVGPPWDEKKISFSELSPAS